MIKKSLSEIVKQLSPTRYGDHHEGDESSSTSMPSSPHRQQHEQKINETMLSASMPSMCMPSTSTSESASTSMLSAPPVLSPAPVMANLDPRSLDPATLAFITSIITAAASSNQFSLSELFAATPSNLQYQQQQPAFSSPASSAAPTPMFLDSFGQQSFLSSSLTTSSNLSSSSPIPATNSSSNSTFLLPYVVQKSTLTMGSKKRINRGRAFKAHKGIYNVVIDGQVRSADYLIESLRTEMAKKQSELPPIIVEGENICEKLIQIIDLLPHLNNPSHCGAVVAGHLFPRDFFVDHILRDIEGNVKAAKGFINHSNREPLSLQASKLFFDILYYFGGAIIEPGMLESWMWVARKGVNDRGNTSKSGRGVRYFVKADYVSILQNDIWASEKSL